MGARIHLFPVNPILLPTVCFYSLLAVIGVGLSLLWTLRVRYAGEWLCCFATRVAEQSHAAALGFGFVQRNRRLQKPRKIGSPLRRRQRSERASVTVLLFALVRVTRRRALAQRHSTLGGHIHT
jgi:hypothetical protein